jgi:hypothetical protein
MNEMSGSLPANYGTLSAEQKDRTKLMLAFAGQRGWLYDEFGRNIQAMMRTDGPHAEFRGLLRQFDDTPPYLDRATIVRGIERVERPYLALLGALTPADLVAVAARSSTLWGDGYLARMAFIIPPAELIKDDRFPKEQRQISPDLMQPLIDWHRRLGIPPVKVESGILSRPGPSPLSIVSVDDDVFEAQYAYTGALLKMLPSLPTDFDGNYGRFGAKAIRIATLLASVGGSSSIKLNHWARAQEITERFRQNLHELYRQVNDTAVVHKPMDALDKVKKALLEKPFPTKREIEQYTGLPGTVVASLLDELLTAEKVICEQSGKTYRYRRASQAG